MRYYKLLSSQQLKYWDQETMRIQKISSTELMERAGTHLFYKFIKRFKNTLKKHPVYIFCGVGNNGGDGLVMARLLHLSGYHIKTIIVPFTEKFSSDFKINLKKLERSGAKIDFFDQQIKLPKKAFVIDAIFGTGLNRPAEGVAKKAIEFINKKIHFYTLSIDIPSGMYVDKVNDLQDPIIKSDLIFSIELPKRSFFFPENIPYINEIKIIKIGLEKKVLKQLKTKYYTYKINVKDGLYRSNDTYKYKFGHAVIISGSYGMTGAAILASKACLRAGGGLVTTIAPGSVYIPLQTSVPEAMIKPALKKNYIDEIPELAESTTVVGIGPGLGLKKKTQKAVLKFISKWKKPLVVDADAINILAMNPEYLKKVPPKSIFTPHDGELKRLLKPKTWNNSLEKIKLAKKFAKTHGIIMVLKGPFTAITDGENVYYNPYANSALAKAGSGDVLTGIITGIYAQGKSPIKSALLGVQMHTKAAEKFNNKTYNKFSLLASDLIEALKIVK